MFYNASSISFIVDIVVEIIFLLGNTCPFQQLCCWKRTFRNMRTRRVGLQYFVNTQPSFENQIRSLLKLLSLLTPSELWMICNVSDIFTYICVYFCMSPVQPPSFICRCWHGQCQSLALAQIHHSLMKQIAQVTFQQIHTLWAIPHYQCDRTCSYLHTLFVLPLQIIIDWIIDYRKSPKFI